MPSVDAESEPLIPERTTIPMPSLSPSSVWLFVGCGLLLAFVLLGLVARASNGPSVDAFMMNAAYIQGYAAYQILIRLLPLGAIAMTWIALKRPQRKGPFLWSAAMILTIDWVVDEAGLPFVNHTGSPALLSDSYPNTRSIVGLIAFAGWFLLINRSKIDPAWKRALSVLTVGGLIVALIAPIALRHTRVVDAAGSLLLGGACWCLGVFVAERFGISLFPKSGSELD